jgi:naphthoate synthase
VIEWQRSGPEPGRDDSDIPYDAAGSVAKITINRPEVRHGLRPATPYELIRAVSVVRGDPETGVIILTGAGEIAPCTGRP